MFPDPKLYVLGACPVLSGDTPFGATGASATSGSVTTSSATGATDTGSSLGLSLSKIKPIVFIGSFDGSTSKSRANLFSSRISI